MPCVAFPHSHWTKDYFIFPVLWQIRKGKGGKPWGKSSCLPHQQGPPAALPAPAPGWLPTLQRLQLGLCLSQITAGASEVSPAGTERGKSPGDEPAQGGTLEDSGSWWGTSNSQPQQEGQDIHAKARGGSWKLNFFEWGQVWGDQSGRELRRPPRPTLPFT